MLRGGRAFDHFRRLMHEGEPDNGFISPPDDGFISKNKKIKHSKSKSKSKSPSPCKDKTAFYAELRRLRYEVLTYDQYKEFYSLLKQFQKEQSKDWYCGETWREDVNRLLC